MKNFLKNKKIYTTLAFISVVVIFLSLAPHVMADPVPGQGGAGNYNALPEEGFWSNAAKYGIAALGAIAVALMGVVSMIMWLFGKFFDYTVLYNLEMTSKMGAIEAGWTIARDVSNMFFIVIILIIAIGTILRVSSYQAKTLLPKLLIIALLINFSLSFGKIFIDATNILGKQFGDSLTVIYGKRMPISEVIIEGARVQSVYVWKGSTDAGQKSFAQKLVDLDSGACSSTTIGSVLCAMRDAPIIAVVGLANRGWDVLSGIANYINSSSISLAAAMEFATAAWGNLILMAIFPFVFFIGGLLLIIRVAMLSILLVLSPLAFLFYILPDTEQHWKKWWSSFLSHAFFFPAFMFLLYISIGMVAVLARSAEVSNMLKDPSSFFTYVLAIIFLIASLIIGRSMGVAGASAAINLARSGRKMAIGYAGGYALRPVAALGERLQQNKTVQSTQIGRQFSKAMAGATTKQVAALGKVREEKAEWLAKQSSQEWAKGYKNLGASGREKFIQSIPDQARGKFLADLKRDDPKMYESTMNTLKVRLGAKALKDFEKAEVQQNMKGLRGAKLADHLNEIEKDVVRGGGNESAVRLEQLKYFKAMDNGQRGELLEAWHDDQTKLTRIMDWKEQELDFDEQDRFTNSVLKRASNPAILNYMNELAKSKKVTEEDQVLKSLSNQQKVYLWDNALTKSAESARDFENKISKLSAEDVSGFNRAAASHIQSKKVPDIVKDWEKLPDDIRRNILADQKPARTVAMMEAAPIEIKKIISNDINIAGVEYKFENTPGKRIMNALLPEGEPGSKILDEMRSAEHSAKKTDEKTNNS